MLRFLLCGFLFGFLLHACPLNAQMLPKSDSTKAKIGVKKQFIPAISFNSDLGLIGGGIYTRFNYGDGEKLPYNAYTFFGGYISTKGFASVGLVNDKLNAFNSKWRIIYGINAGRLLNNNYFGQGNNTSFNRSSWEEDGLYNYDSYNVGTDIQARYPIWEREQVNDPLFDVFIRYFGSYQIGYADDNTLIDQLQPEGFDGGIISQLGGGLIFDSRDNEMVPTTGWRIDAEAGIASPLLGSEWTVPYWAVQIRRFFPLPFSSTLGLQYRHIQRYGQMPFWHQPTLGGEQQLRGYALNRFTDKGANTYAAELRTWLWQPSDIPLKLGIQGFVEAGRVFDDTYAISTLWQGLNTTYGGGIALGFTDSDLILRLDYGISDEINRTYITVGYAF